MSILLKHEGVNTMNLKKSKGRIKDLMRKFVDEVKDDGKMGWTDINRESENVLAELLSEIYGHTALKNLNTSEGPNFPAIDLGDKETGIAYQITSKADSRVELAKNKRDFKEIC